MTPPRRRLPLARRALVGLAVASGALLAGCAQFEAADAVTTPVHVDRQPDALVVEAPAWFAPETLVVLCPEAPETVGDVFAPGRDTIQLAETCHSYGRFESATGLSARLPLAGIDPVLVGTFDRAADWWIVLVAVRGDAAGAIFDTQVPGGPIEAAGAQRATPSG